MKWAVPAIALSNASVSHQHDGGVAAVDFINDTHFLEGDGKWAPAPGT